jgi:TatD DNase family protein
MYRNIPLDRLLLETDAPFLTPAPFRGRVNEPAYVREVAKHQASIRDIPFGDIVSISTANAEALFALR